VLMATGAIACVPVFLTGRRINRDEGGLFVAAYGGYLAWLLLVRPNHLLRANLAAGTATRGGRRR
jgi:hypothetical protein